MRESERLDAPSRMTPPKLLLVEVLTMLSVTLAAPAFSMMALRAAVDAADGNGIGVELSSPPPAPKASGYCAAPSADGVPSVTEPPLMVVLPM